MTGAVQLERLKEQVRAACRQAGLGAKSQEFLCGCVDDAYKAGQGRLYVEEPEALVEVELLADHPPPPARPCVSAGRRFPASDPRRDGKVKCYGCGEWVDVVLGPAP